MQDQKPGILSSAPIVLSAANLSKSYGQIRAVDDISFNVRHGEILGLLGPNGAGETTPINRALGVLDRTAGSIRIGDVYIGRDLSRALRSTNFAAVYAPLPGNLTLVQNLRVFGVLYCVPELPARLDFLIA